MITIVEEENRTPMGVDEQREGEFKEGSRHSTDSHEY